MVLIEGGARVHTSLGRDGQPMGREPHRGAGARAAVPCGGPAHRRGHRGGALCSALQCEHQPAGATELEAGADDASVWATAASSSSTSHDVWQLFLTVVQQRVEREIEPTIAALGRLAAEARAEKQPEVTARIAGMHAFLRGDARLVSADGEVAARTASQSGESGRRRHKWLPSRRKAKGEK